MELWGRPWTSVETALKAIHFKFMLPLKCIHSSSIFSCPWLNILVSISLPPALLFSLSYSSLHKYNMYKVGFSGFTGTFSRVNLQTDCIQTEMTFRFTSFIHILLYIIYGKSLNKSVGGSSEVWNQATDRQDNTSQICCQSTVCKMNSSSRHLAREHSCRALVLLASESNIGQAVLLFQRGTTTLTFFKHFKCEIF